MPKCPQCMSDIAFLVLLERGWSRFHYTKDGQEPRKIYVESLLLPDGDVDEIYKCPRCDKTLFANSLDASTFLLVDVEKACETDAGFV